jgi:uncharacterized protein
MDDSQKKIINETIDFVKQTLAQAEGGHDWWHIYRVWTLSKQIAKNEQANAFVVELGALLHDIADSKFHNGDEEIGPRKAREFLTSQSVDEEIIHQVEKIIANISFKGGAHQQEFKSPELDVVQDADRLDALGAIGIARVFSFGGHTNRTIYDPNIPPKINMSKEEYKTHRNTSLNHFYEKLLLLKDRMNTPTGRNIAEQRHLFLQQYLDRFHKEWNGET